MFSRVNALFVITQEIFGVDLVAHCNYNALHEEDATDGGKGSPQFQARPHPKRHSQARGPQNLPDTNRDGRDGAAQTFQDGSGLRLSVSIKVMSQVWDNSKSEGAALLLLLTIADHCHDD